MNETFWKIKFIVWNTTIWWDKIKWLAPMEDVFWWMNNENLPKAVVSKMNQLVIWLLEINDIWVLAWWDSISGECVWVDWSSKLGRMLLGNTKYMENIQIKLDWN